MKNKMPESLKSKIKTEILVKLNPAPSRVFVKISVIQFLVSFIVLAICPQFSLGFFPHSFLGHIFMNWGEIYCNLSCGAIFLTSGILSSIIFLTNDELRVFRQYRVLHLLLISLLSLTAFVLFGVQFQLFMFFIWGLGALVASLMSFEIYWSIRTILLSAQEGQR
jgi:hypothetical protein